MKPELETFVPMRLKRRQYRLVDTDAPAHDPGLLESIGRAMYWQSLLDAGVVTSSADWPERKV